MTSFLLAESHWPGIRDGKPDLLVLPWGATEAHNTHLPYATDVYETEAIAAEAARLAAEKGARVLVLPAVPYGVNTGQKDIPLDMNLNPSTQFIILKDLITTLDRQGMYRLLILNGHGGNEFKPMVRELGALFPGMHIAVSNWFRILNHKDYFDDPGDHADEMETSLMLHLRPDLVRPPEVWGRGKDISERIDSLKKGILWTERQWSATTEDTGVGDPSRASAEKGERFFTALTGILGNAMAEFALEDEHKL